MLLDSQSMLSEGFVWKLLVGMAAAIVGMAAALWKLVLMIREAEHEKLQILREAAEDRIVLRRALDTVERIRNGKDQANMGEAPRAEAAS